MPAKFQFIVQYNPPCHSEPVHTLAWESVPNTYFTDCHTSDIGHWFAMTTGVTVIAEGNGDLRCKSRGRLIIAPTMSFDRLNDKQEFKSPIQKNAHPKVCIFVFEITQ